jgi:hypothetical protein
VSWGRPEDALERARAAAAERRADYEADPAAGPTALPGASETVSDEQLREWAVIEIDPGELYSTRRLGAPITFLKRALLRLLRQYTLDLEARQTRFNLAVLARLRELEDERRSG